MYQHNFISVGIDVAADFSWFSVLAPDGREFRKPFKVDHDNNESLDNAVLTIKKAEEQYSMRSRILMESTGIYHLPLFRCLLDSGFDVFVINPLITNSNKNTGIRKVKNDKYDAKRIALLGYSQDLKVSVMPDPMVMNLKSLCREYYNLVDQRSAYVNKLKSQLRIVFPGYIKVFSDVTSAGSIVVLRSFPSPEAILEAKPDDIIKRIATASKRGLEHARVKYDLLHKAAVNAQKFRMNISNAYVLIDMFVDLILTYDKQIDHTLSKIHEFVEENQSEGFIQQIQYLDSIPGVGFLSAVTMVCEIGDFTAFSKPKQLLAYFGVDPSVNQSGYFTGTENKMSKRGSRIARRVLYSIAIASIRTKPNGIAVNPVLQEYYKKKKESKAPKVALGAVMHKISNIIFAVLRDHKPFELRTPSQHESLYKMTTAA